MKTIEIDEIAALLESYSKTEQPVILTRNGQPIAALFSIENIDIESLSLSLNPKFVNLVEQARKSQKEEGRIFLEETAPPLEL